MNKKLLKFSLVLCVSIFMAISCSSNSKPDEKKDWNGPTLTKGNKFDNLLDVELPKQTTDNIPVSIPVSVDTSVKDVAFEFVSGIELDEKGADKTTATAKIESKDIVKDSFKYENGKIVFSILGSKNTEITERKMRLIFKVTSSTHKDYTMSVFAYFVPSESTMKN